MHAVVRGVLLKCGIGTNGCGEEYMNVLLVSDFQEACPSSFLGFHIIIGDVRLIRVISWKTIVSLCILPRERGSNCYSGIS